MSSPKHSLTALLQVYTALHSLILGSFTGVYVLTTEMCIGILITNISRSVYLPIYFQICKGITPVDTATVLLVRLFGFIPGVLLTAMNPPEVRSHGLIPKLAWSISIFGTCGLAGCAPETPLVVGASMSAMAVVASGTLFGRFLPQYPSFLILADTGGITADYRLITSQPHPARCCRDPSPQTLEPPRSGTPSQQ